MDLPVALRIRCWARIGALLGRVRGLLLDVVVGDYIDGGGASASGSVSASGAASGSASGSAPGSAAWMHTRRQHVVALVKRLIEFGGLDA